jgi:hypothetical protein
VKSNKLSLGNCWRRGMRLRWKIVLWHYLTLKKIWLQR